MTSRPLFIKVAESTVTFGPIDHLGWFSACSTVTWSRSSSGCAQKGPPLAVMTRRRTDSRLSPHRHCQIALCSESTGLTPPSPDAPCARSATARMTRSPAMTRTSLVASATSFPAFRAASVGARARAPGMATTTMSQRGSVTSASTRVSKSGSPAWPYTTISALRLVERRPSVRPNRRRRAGLRSMTSSVCWPIEPVAPSTATLIGRLNWPGSKEGEQGQIEVDGGRGKEDRVQPVERAAVSGDQVGRVLHLCDPLHLRLDEIAHLRADAPQQAQCDRMQGRQADDGGDTDQHHCDRACDACDRTFDGLPRADRPEERMPPNAAPNQQRRRITGHDGEDREQRPHQTVGLRRVQEQVVVERHADVEGAGHPHRPTAEALAATRHDQERG